MGKKRIASAFLCMVAAVLLYGQTSENTVFERFPSSAGFYANSSTGIGLSYQKWMGDLGFQVAAGGTYTPEPAYGDIFNYSIQAGLSRFLYKEDFAKWFSGGLTMVAMAGHRGRQEWSSDENRAGSFLPTVSIGAGLGLEAVLFQHYSTELQLMYIGTFLATTEIGFGVGWALRYRF